MFKNLLSRFWKKSDNPYPKSFGKRLTRRIMLRMFIFMGIPSFLLFWMIFGSSYVVFEEFGQKLLKGRYEEVRRITSDVSVASVNTAPYIEDNLDNPDKLYDIMECMVRTNKRIRSCGISFIADYYPQKGHWFCPYAVRRDNDTIETKTIGDKDHDYLQAKWFRRLSPETAAIGEVPSLIVLTRGRHWCHTWYLSTTAISASLPY